MAVRTMRRAFSSIPKEQTLQFVQKLVRMLMHLLWIAVSFVLLPLDNAILLAVYIVGFVSQLLPGSCPSRRRKAALRAVHFYPKTVLVTGVDTPHGLAVARCWYYEGHRVVGTSITDSSIRSGESMSQTLTAFYNISHSQYVSTLLDIIHREKVDIWMPCSDKATVMEDAMAKEVIESRTNCKCIHLDTELADRFSRPESFIQYLVEKDLPVLEDHHVQSRASIHRILHRSPTKVYQMRRVSSIAGDSKVLVLPKRTLSQTYTEVSEIQISKDSPWMLQQQTRLGTYFAEMLVVRGFVEAIKIRPSDQQLGWGRSRLDEALAIAIRKLMERFAMKGGPRLTGQLCLKLMVDEEFDTNSVRHVIHIASCTQGAAAIRHLLQDASCSIPAGCLTVLAAQTNGMPTRLTKSTNAGIRSLMCKAPSQGSRFYEALKTRECGRLVLVVERAMQLLDRLIYEAGQLVFWKNWQYSSFDPLPWWWDAHIYQPVRHFGMAFNVFTEAQGKTA
ncbi:uncharacterized protein CDV56_106856 [Aspergillus thermomutatus]|uniref:Uncharacterized protein n=1 Tax=Aspergillus thermomutatus TaxID=41047 RepID=A0A397GXQ3_ASPTH|nr:uncharacterized protein CDV56_106856 [Aspergillus thermomutatus]RHZ53843.1 hypothetical protein CDV56_106856 [Aspergillus thermomutatus]